jgi:hypothetical protein
VLACIATVLWRNADGAMAFLFSTTTFSRTGFPFTPVVHHTVNGARSGAAGAVVLSGGAEAAIFSWRGDRARSSFHPTTTIGIARGPVGPVTHRTVDGAGFHRALCEFVEHGVIAFVTIVHVFRQLAVAIVRTIAAADRTNAPVTPCTNTALPISARAMIAIFGLLFNIRRHRTSFTAVLRGHKHFVALALPSTTRCRARPPRRPHFLAVDRTGSRVAGRHVYRVRALRSVVLWFNENRAESNLLAATA